jgi:nucleotide-binding universal stress UspA family protein
MLHALLVPLDGSPFAEQALPLALSVARRARATIQLAHVHVPLVYFHDYEKLEGLLDEKIREREHAYLEGVAQKLTGVSVVPVTSTLLPEGPVSDALQKQAAATEALVVMTTHGRGALSRFWLGSVADELVRRGPATLLLVRPREDAADPAREPALQHVLIPLDGSPHAEQVLDSALELGGLMQARYTLVRVVAPVPVVGADLPGYAAGGLDLPRLEQLQTEARAYLEAVADRLRARSLQVQTCVVVNKQPAIGILETARTQAVDLIALETHGRSGLPRLFLGSVADKVVRGATVPVLVHRSIHKKK